HSEKADDPPKLTKENFDGAYAAWVGQYDKTLTHYDLPKYTPVGGNSPSQQSGATGQGRLYLNTNEDAELNTHLPGARDAALVSSASNALAAAFAPVPDPSINLHFWGIGGSVKLNVGTALVAAAKIAGDISGIVAGWEREQAGMASRTASHER